MNTDDMPKELVRCLGCRVKPCERACPLGVSPHDFIAAARTGDFIGAAKLIAAKNPLPQTCGLVCPDYFCRKACIRAKIDTAIEIPCLQALLMCKGGLPPLVLPEAKGKTAAVVGSGPAGLGAVYEFLLNGWNVELFEKNAYPGGAARLIPEHRLPKSVLDAEIARLVQNSRVTLHLNEVVDDFSVLEQTFAAVVAALGEPQAHSLGIRGEEFCLPYTDYLRNPEQWPCRKAAVVGGGEVALDCAITLKKLGCETVDILVRRRREDMRIMAHGHQELNKHGIIVRELTSVTDICRDNNFCALTTVRNRINENGRAEPLDNTQQRLEGYERVIMALGSYFPRDKLPQNIFIAGDMNGTFGTVVQALASGMAAARQAVMAAETGVAQ